MHETSENITETIDAADPSRVRMLQLTDCHILAGAEDRMRDMNTRTSFEAVCNAAIGANPELDLLVATGDLTQDSSPSAYRYLSERFEQTGLPVFCLPGNHDIPEVMQEHLRGENVSSARILLIGAWVILLLDSTLEGEASGALPPAQLDLLDRALTQHAGLHALVCLHHHPLPVGSQWIDQLGLKNSAVFTDMIARHANVRGILWGHVHQQWHQQIDGIEWISTPSTCIQFKPGSDDFALDSLAPGYRCLDLLSDGTISTRVFHLEGFDRRQD